VLVTFDCFEYIPKQIVQHQQNIDSTKYERYECCRSLCSSSVKRKTEI